jgi:hypothetical protein
MYVGEKRSLGHTRIVSPQPFPQIVYMHRREALSRIGILLGGTLSASTLSGLMAGCSTPPELGFNMQILTAPQVKLIRRIADIIIPETDTPGATAAGVDRFIDTMVAEYYPKSVSDKFRVDLDDYIEIFLPDDLSDVQLTRLVSEEDRAEFSHLKKGQGPSLYGQIKELVVTGYYTSEIGMTEELRLNPMGPARYDIPRSDVDRAWSD